MKKNIKLFIVDYQKLLYGILNTTRKILWFLARDAFLFTLVLVLLTIVFGEFLFYNYVLLTDIKELDATPNITKFQESSYKSVISELSDREHIFFNPSSISHQNPF